MTGSAISIWMSECGLRAARTRRAAVLITCAFSLGVMAPAASAASGPFQIGTVSVPSDGYDSGSLDVDANGTAYVAWPDYTKNVVDYCVLPDGASACAESGALSPIAGSLTQTGNGVEVLVNNGSVSIIAAVAAGGNSATEWTEMWQASDGTGNFTLVNGGNSVAYPDPKSNSPADLQDGVVVPGSGQLGVCDFTPGGPTSFEAFPQIEPSGVYEVELTGVCVRYARAVEQSGSGEQFWGRDCGSRSCVGVRPEPGDPRHQGHRILDWAVRLLVGEPRRRFQ